MKKIISLLCLLSLCGTMLTGCVERYDQNEVVSWFQENILNEDIVISKEYETRTENGETDLVWTAYLADMPEVQFELIDHEYYSVFPTHTMQTTYYMEMGEYYLNQYKSKYPSRFEGLTIGVPTSYYIPTVHAEYQSEEEIEGLCRKMEAVEAYIQQQKYPCSIRYGIACSEPLTFIADNGAPDEIAFQDRYTYAFVDTEYPEEADNLAENLQYKSENFLAWYAYTYRIDFDRCTQEALDQCYQTNDNLFTITDKDGNEISYDDVFLTSTAQMSLGTLYEVLARDGSFNVSGNSEEFSFTGVDGSRYTFSYSSRKPIESRSFNNLEYLQTFTYVQNGEEQELAIVPVIDRQEFEALTGKTYQWSGKSNQEKSEE